MNIIQAYKVPMLTDVMEISPEKYTSAEAMTFAKLLSDITPSVSPPPHEILVRQAHMFELSVSVDLGAKIAGSLSQSINKLVNMA